jgi:hypothetical protein
LPFGGISEKKEENAKEKRKNRHKEREMEFKRLKLMKRG